MPIASKVTLRRIAGCFCQSIPPKSAQTPWRSEKPSIGVSFEPSRTDHVTAFEGASVSILITPYGPGSERKFALLAFVPKAGVVQLPSPPGLVNLTSSTNHQSQQVPDPVGM